MSFYEVDNYVEDVTSCVPEFHHLKSHCRKLRLGVVILFILLRTISIFSTIALQVVTALCGVFSTPSQLLNKLLYLIQHHPLPPSELLINHPHKSMRQPTKFIQLESVFRLNEWVSTPDIRINNSNRQYTHSDFVPTRFKY